MLQFSLQIHGRRHLEFTMFTHACFCFWGKREIRVPDCFYSTLSKYVGDKNQQNNWWCSFLHFVCQNCEGRAYNDYYFCHINIFTLICTASILSEYYCFPNFLTGLSIPLLFVECCHQIKIRNTRPIRCYSFHPMCLLGLHNVVNNWSKKLEHYRCIKVCRPTKEKYLPRSLFLTPTLPQSFWDFGTNNRWLIFFSFKSWNLAFQNWVFTKK